MVCFLTAILYYGCSLPGTYVIEKHPIPVELRMNYPYVIQEEYPNIA